MDDVSDSKLTFWDWEELLLSMQRWLASCPPDDNLIVHVIE